MHANEVMVVLVNERGAFERLFVAFQRIYRQQPKNMAHPTGALPILWI